MQATIKVKIGTAVGALALFFVADAGVAAPSATRDVMLASASNGQSTFVITDSITLPKNSLVRGNLVFEGNAASGTTLDCNGSTIEATGKTFDERIAITVRSLQLPDKSWDAPHNVTIKNCIINGNIRLYGLNMNANGDAMRESSGHADHTAFAQQAAPREVSLLHVKITALNGVPVYIGPGVTKTTFADSEIDGSGSAVALYMDAESAGNVIRDNTFSYQSDKREALSIDGSAHNSIVGNIFNGMTRGGVFIYRNCGEGGVIRHLKPEYNTIERNTFVFAGGDSKASKPAIWVGSRQGHQPFCFRDPARPVGSSLSPMDFAQHNTVRGNVLVGWPAPAIRNDDSDNSVTQNINR